MKAERNKGTFPVIGQGPVVRTFGTKTSTISTLLFRVSMSMLFSLVPRMKRILEKRLPSHSCSPKRKWYLDGGKEVLCGALMMSISAPGSPCSPESPGRSSACLIVMFWSHSEIPDFLHIPHVFFLWVVSDLHVPINQLYLVIPKLSAVKASSLGSQTCGTCKYIPPVGAWQIYIFLTSLLIILYYNCNTYRSN